MAACTVRSSNMKQVYAACQWKGGRFLFLGQLCLGSSLTLYHHSLLRLPCGFFFSARIFLFFLLFRSARAQKFHSLRQDWSTVAQRAETTVAKCSLTSCMCARFPVRFPLLCLDSIVSPFQLRWVNGVCVFKCNLPPALSAE